MELAKLPRKITSEIDHHEIKFFFKLKKTLEEKGEKNLAEELGRRMQAIFDRGTKHYYYNGQEEVVHGKR